MPFAIAVAVSAAVALLAMALRALSRSGALAATVVGTAILWPLGWPGFAILAAFFAGSTLISRLSTAVAGGSDQADTEMRDHRQVLANGGWAAAAAPAEWLAPGLGLWLATVALAASGADTWATAFGALSPRPPRDLLTRAPVPAGTSGGVTWFGTSGGFMGAATVGLAAIGFGAPPSLLLSSALIGEAAMLLDSLLGSRWQARFHCPACDLPTERPTHRCGTITRPVAGIRWLDNDAVNAVAGAVALAAGLAAWWVFGAPAARPGIFVE